MAKGKKTLIKEIKRINDNEIMINGIEYIITEDIADIETATTMKISSNGNRILRFEDEKKKASIDIKRDINIMKYSFLNKDAASKFKKTKDRNFLTQEDKVDIIGNTTCFKKARLMISNFTDKKSENFDKKSGSTNFYIFEEVKK